MPLVEGCDEPRAFCCRPLYLLSRGGLTTGTQPNPWKQIAGGTQGDGTDVDEHDYVGLVAVITP